MDEKKSVAVYVVYENDQEFSTELYYTDSDMISPYF